MNKKVVFLSLLLPAVALAESSDQRINLWPLFYSDPPDKVGCFPLFYSGNDYSTIPLTLSWYSSSAGGKEDYVALLGLSSVRFVNDEYSHSWLFPLYYHDSESFISPLWAYGPNYEAFPPALAWHHRRKSSDVYLGLLGLGGAVLRDNGDASSWFLPLYYLGADAFVSPLVGWDSDLFGFPAALSWYHCHGSQESYWLLAGLGSVGFQTDAYDHSRLFPLYYHDADGTFISLPYARGAQFCWCPCALSGCSLDARTGDLRSLKILLGLLFDATYDADGCTGFTTGLYLSSYTNRHHVEKLQALLIAGYEMQNGAYSESHFLPFYSHNVNGTFLSIPYSCWNGEKDRENELYGLLAFRSKGKDYSRFNILWKFFDCEQENGNTKIDAFPGITYDSTVDGTQDFSLWYRFFRYRSTRQGVTDLSVFFIPFL